MCYRGCWLAFRQCMRPNKPRGMTLYYNYPNMPAYNPDAYSTSQLGFPDVARHL